MKANKALREVSQLFSDRFALLVVAIYLVHVPAGTGLSRQGEMGDAYCISQDGVPEVTNINHGAGRGHETADTHFPTRLRSGDSFGELALPFGCLRAASVTST